MITLDKILIPVGFGSSVIGTDNFFDNPCLVVGGVITVVGTIVYGLIKQDIEEKKELKKLKRKY